MGRYRELMSRVTVTAGMRSRILEAVCSGQGRGKRRWLKPLLTAACLAVVLLGAVALPDLVRGPAENPRPEVTAPAVSTVDTAEALEALVGFSVPEAEFLPFVPEETIYTAYGSAMAQITYRGDTQQAVLRKSSGTEDNSGDYTEYGDILERTVDGLTVTLKGESGQYVLAVWTDGAYAFSLRLSPGAAEQTWLEILEQIR